MTDLALRLAGRSEDATRVLAQRLRVGDVSQERVAMASALGHLAALELADPAPLPKNPRKRAAAGCLALGHAGSVHWACDLADMALAHSGSLASLARQARGVAAARAWADCPCEWHMAAVGLGAWPGAADWTERAAWQAAGAPLSGSAWEISLTAWDAVRAGAVTWPEAHAMLAERLLRGEA